MNYMLIIIECEISPLLFQCCPYVGNVQITRISCWCELSLLRVVLGSLWYVTGWGFCFCFPLLRIALWTMSLNPFGIRFSLSCYVEAVVPKIVEPVVDFEIIFRCDVKWIFDRVVLINSNFFLFIEFKCSVISRFTLNTLIICIIYIVGKTGCYNCHLKAFILLFPSLTC